MPPHEGLVHPKEYDIKDSNVELIGSDLDHRVKYNSAVTEPAWQGLGQEPGLRVWRIENFEVIPWPKEKTGQFYDGDSFIVLHSYKVGDNKLGHDIFFWLGSKTTQDEAGTAAYKTVELDEFLHGAATQHREVQAHPSDEFLALFTHYQIRKGGVRSGFTHVEPEAPKEITTLLRIFKKGPKSRTIIVHEVEPTWESLDDKDVFVLDKGEKEKLFVWQGKDCSPMEKAKAAQVVNDLTINLHRDLEVISQHESRSKIFVDLLGGKDVFERTFHCPRPGHFQKQDSEPSDSPKKLFRLSDDSGQLTFDLVKDGEKVRRSDLDSNDVFLYDTNTRLWVWQGSGASAKEKAMWLKVAQAYIRRLQESQDNSEAYYTPISKVVDGYESPAFLKTIEV
ncbi:hypothetical protein N7509_011680 [Penicillium cosmopolitanum]|uniref:Gelsolin-like domain-containing protein n=1 Tax=Penicillium cosmopolitanum TaxID=1131564 RepID=A0A9W9SH91_9EURO|nr:uncharacterized protein N7509_011680 [Penicillium cosmopolitanum]KAJ5378561.1 hypothetical protein N7509_011680 [Penicillium cosmopolitanum]